MSSEAPAQPPTDIDNLSKEVLQRIVVLVAAQDRAIRESSIPLAAAPPRTQPGVARAMIPDGKWSFWYGHGVSVLSLVDKRFRHVTMPFLCETVKAIQLSKPIFHFGHIPPALLAGITSLDLRAATADAFAAAALALEDMPNLRHIEYAVALMDTVKAEDYSEEGAHQPDNIARREYAVEAFITAVNKFTEVTIQGDYRARDGLNGCFCPFVDLRNLRRVTLSLPFYSVFNSSTGARSVSSKPLKVLRSSPSRPPRATSSRSWQRRSGRTQSACPPSARSRSKPRTSRSLPSSSASPRPSSTSTSHLDVTFQSYSSLPDNVENVVSLPSLTSLRIAGPPLCGSFLAHVNLTHLNSLELVLDSSSTGSVDCSELIPECVPLPIGLNLHLSSHRLIKLHDLEALMARCDQGGVAFSSGQHSLLSAFSPPARDKVEEPSNEASLPRRDAVIAALKWADARIFECWETGDTAGVQEMAEALREVGERKMLETLYEGGVLQRLLRSACSLPYLDLHSSCSVERERREG